MEYWFKDIAEDSLLVENVVKQAEAFLAERMSLLIFGKPSLPIMTLGRGITDVLSETTLLPLPKRWLR